MFTVDSVEMKEVIYLDNARVISLPHFTGNCDLDSSLPLLRWSRRCRGCPDINFRPVLLGSVGSGEHHGSKFSTAELSARLKG